MAAKSKPSPLSIEVIRLPHGRDLPLPAYQTKGAAGMDLHAAVPDGTILTLDPCDRALVPTGLVMQLPAGYEAQVRPRSGLAFKNGVTVLNSPGTIDSDYRGEVQVLLINLGREPFEITRGMRIAQLVVASVSRVAIVEGKTVVATRRGTGGFGSTGVVAVKKSKRVPVARKSRNARPS
jgi:dUTP pyrophosphatase